MFSTQGLSTNTEISYRDTLKLLFCFVSDKLNKNIDLLLINEFDEEMILCFLNHLETQRDNSTSTRNIRLAGIRKFFHFLEREQPELLGLCQAIHSIPRKKTIHKNAVSLDDGEIKSLLNSVNSNDRHSKRDTALLHLLFNSGARVQEIVDLSINDLRLDQSGQVNLLGKGRKQRACPLWPDTVQLIKDYLLERTPNDPHNKALFLNAKGFPITRFGIRYIVRKYAGKAEKKCPSIKTKSVSPHTLRHSIAMMLLRAGVLLESIQHILGHANLNTTHTYAELDLNMKRKVLEKARVLEKNPANEKIPKWKKPGIMEFLRNLTKGGLPIPPALS